MKFLIAILLFSGSVLAQKLEIRHLTGDFYIYTTYNLYKGTPFPSNGMYVVSNKGVILIDTPWDTTQFQPLLDSIQKRHNKKVIHCIATHFHADRTAGMEYFRKKGIKTWASKLTYDLCKKHKEKQPQFYFKKDTVFTLGQYKLQTFHPGAGHTKDNILIWFGDQKILYGGCFIKSTESETIGNLSDADVKAWPKSINRAMAKFPNPKFVIPGHQGWESNQGLQHTLQLLMK